MLIIRLEVIGNSGIVRIQRCQASFKTRQNGATSLINILKECTGILDDSLWLISLLSRKRLTLYAGDASYIPSDNSKSRFHKAMIHRNLHLGYESAMGYGEHESDLLISPNKLKMTLFQELLTSYETSKYHDVIRRAIIYVLMSYERAYFEVYIGLVYLALETLVAGLSPSKEKENTKLLETTPLEHLTDQLRQVIHKEVKDENIASGLIENLKKINSTKPMSLANRLLSLFHQYNVPINKLWPSGVNVDKKLREMIGRRDLYIHRGEIGDHDEYLFDLARLRTLVELWILKLLNCPDDSINFSNLSSLVPIDRIESPMKTND